MMGPQYVFTQVNDAYYQLVGYRESIGRPLAEVVPEASEQKFVGLLDEVMRTGEPFLVQRTPDGPAEMRYIDQVYMPCIEADGTRAGTVEITCDLQRNLVLGSRVLVTWPAAWAATAPRRAYRRGEYAHVVVAAGESVATVKLTERVPAFIAPTPAPSIDRSACPTHRATSQPCARPRCTLGSCRCP